MFPLCFLFLSLILLAGDPPGEERPFSQPVIPPVYGGDIYIAYPPHTNDCEKELVELSNLSSDPLKVVRTASDYFLQGAYANASMELRTFTDQFDFECEGTGCLEPGDDIWKYETVMCYYHINYAFDYMDNYLDTLVDGYQVPQGLTFYAFQDGTNTTLGQDEAMYFGAQCNPQAVLRDYAQDADYIVSVAFETFFLANDYELPNTNDGVATGTLSYLARAYMRARGHDHPDIGAYGGLPPRQAVSTEFDGDYNSIAGETRKRARAQVWATALMEMSDAVGEVFFLKVLLTAVKEFDGGPGGNDQPEAAVILFDAARQMWRAGELTAGQLCSMQSVLRTRYPDTEGLEAVDYFIKNTNTDTGREPFPDNEPVWNSPSIWVRNAPDQGLAHQDALFDPDNPQTVRIQVNNQGCSADSSAVLELYFSIAEFGLVWDATWMDFFTEQNGVSVLSGGKVAEVSIPAFDSSSEAIVDIEWMPPNPQDFGQETLNVSLLARIVSEKDGLNQAEGFDVRDNVRNNNNIAWRAILVRGL